MSSSLKFRVLRLLVASLLLTQRELFKSLRVSLGRVNYCIDALLGKGLQKFKTLNIAKISDYKLRYQLLRFG
jgi:hypothetical protein